MIEEQRGTADAESLLEDLGIDKLPIDPFQVASEINDESFKLLVEKQPFESKNILGKAVGNDKGALVYVNSNIDDVGRLNFTAAHELGHVCMHIMNNVQTSFECSAKQMSSSFNDPIEKEANGFASGLLMPKHLINSLTDHDINWENIKRIKDECGSSLEASFRRMCALYKEPSALVIHQNGRFKRFVSSSNFAPYIEMAPMTSEQKILCADGLNDEFLADFESVDAMDWVNPQIKSDTLHSIFTSSISLKNDITYTLLKYDDDCFDE